MKVGAVRLKKYLLDNGIKESHFAKIIGVFPSTICRIIRGTNCPDIQTGILIETHTKGKIRIADWVADVPEMKSSKAPQTSGKINRK